MIFSGHHHSLIIAHNKGEKFMSNLWARNGLCQRELTRPGYCCMWLYSEIQILNVVISLKPEANSDREAKGLGEPEMILEINVCDFCRPVSMA